jgi:hypothetical protein
LPTIGQRLVDMRLHQPDRLRQARVVAVEPAERDQRLRVGRGACLIVDEHLATSSATAMPSRERTRCSIRSKVGEAPPLREDRTVDDVAVGAHVGVGKGGGEILQIFPMVVAARPSSKPARPSSQPPASTPPTAAPSRALRMPCEQVAGVPYRACRSRRPPSARRLAVRRRSFRSTATGRPDVVTAACRLARRASSRNRSAGDAVCGAQRIDCRGDAHDRGSRSTRTVTLSVSVLGAKDRRFSLFICAS